MSTIAWLAVALVTAVLTAFALEWTARHYVRSRLGSDIRITQALRDRFTGWTNNPAFRRSDIAHNQQGFRRVGTVSLHKPPGARRVFLLGGSTAYGAQGGFPHIDNRWNRIRNDELIDAFLEERLRRTNAHSHTEVINAAVSGYRIHQQLALIQSRICRYRPDDVVLMDGYNDFISLYNWARSGCACPDFDVYESTPGREDFDALANPAGVHSLAAFGKAWLSAESSLFGILSHHIPGRVKNPWATVPAAECREFAPTVQLADLTGDDRVAATEVLAQAGYYADIARMIHRVLAVYGIRAVFALQPILILSGKPFTAMEQKFVEYEWKTGGPLYFYLFREFYRKIDSDMSAAACAEGFEYLNLTGIFDDTTEQTFSDFAHLTPAGNRIIGEKLFSAAFRAVPAVQSYFS